MTHALGIFALLSLIPLNPSQQSEPPWVAAALPAHASVQKLLRIPGRPNAYTVSYGAQRPYLGVIVRGGAGGKLLWSHRLPTLPTSVDTPGPAGLFRARVALPHGASLFAYVLRKNRVLSGIVHASSGQITGDEELTLARNGFEVQSRDAHHVGSVRYRLVRRYQWSSNIYRAVQTHREPDYSPSQYPLPNGVIHAQHGDTVLLRLRIAQTEPQRETGLMYAQKLDPDTGMIFAWPTSVLESFWMENTYIPLTVAFLAPDGTIQEMQDMQPLTTTYHTPVKSYLYAIEVNQGYFKSHGITPGDRVQLHLGTIHPTPK